MSGYGIVSQQKVKSASSFDSRKSHNERLEICITKNVKRELIHKNICLQKSNYKNYDEFVLQKKQAIYNYNKNKKADEKKRRFVQSKVNPKTGEKETASMFTEFVFTHSHECMSEEQSINYLKDCYEFVQKRFPDNEIISADIHLDETTPHLHIIMAYWNEKECKFNQKDLMEKKLTDINKIRDDMQEEVNKNYNLSMQDGKATKGRYDGQKADLEKAKEKELREKQEEREIEERLEFLNAYNDTRKTLIKSPKEKILEDYVWVAEKHLVTKSKEIERLHEVINNLPSHKEFKKLKFDLQHTKAENEELAEEIKDLKMQLMNLWDSCKTFISNSLCKLLKPKFIEEQEEAQSNRHESGSGSCKQSTDSTKQNVKMFENSGEVNNEIKTTRKRKM